MKANHDRLQAAHDRLQFHKRRLPTRSGLCRVDQLERKAAFTVCRPYSLFGSLVRPMAGLQMVVSGLQTIVAKA
jgi:hypothetical protein